MFLLSSLQKTSLKKVLNEIIFNSIPSVNNKLFRFENRFLLDDFEYRAIKQIEKMIYGSEFDQKKIYKIVFFTGSINIVGVNAYDKDENLIYSSFDPKGIGKDPAAVKIVNLVLRKGSRFNRVCFHKNYEIFESQ